MTGLHLPSRRLFLLFSLSYALFIVYVTTLPFDFSPSLNRASEKLAQVRRDVLLGPDGEPASIPDMVQNVVLFVPFGVLVALAFPARRPVLVSVGAIAAGAIVSGGVETLQLFTATRVSSLNDLATNTLGAAAGATAVVAGRATGVFAGMAAVFARTPPALRHVLIWTAILVIAAWHPFDSTIDVGSVGGKVRRLLVDVWQIGTAGDEGADAVRYGLFAGACAAWMRQLRWPRATLHGIAAGASMALVLEASQLFIQSRMPGLKDALVGAAGSLAGAALFDPAVIGRRRPATALVVAVSALAAALMLLSPFEMRAEPLSFRSVPLLGYVRPTPERAVSHAVELTLAFFPIGFVLGLQHRRQRWLRAGAAALVVAGVLEYGQSWIAGRYPDVTDVAVMVLGALAGTWATLLVESELRLARPELAHGDRIHSDYDHRTRRLP